MFVVRIFCSKFITLALVKELSMRLLDLLGIVFIFFFSKHNLAVCSRKCQKRWSTAASLVGLPGQRLIVVSEMLLRSTVTSLRPR